MLKLAENAENAGS